MQPWRYTVMVGACILSRSAPRFDCFESKQFRLLALLLICDIKKEVCYELNGMKWLADLLFMS